MWQNHLQQPQHQMLNKKHVNNSVNGKVPMLMANNDVFTIGPYRARKDSMRVSVLEKYEIIGYIASGTYGKVYKAKGKVSQRPDNYTGSNSNLNGSSDNIDSGNYSDYSINENERNVNEAIRHDVYGSKIQNSDLPKSNNAYKHSGNEHALPRNNDNNAYNSSNGGASSIANSQTNSTFNDNNLGTTENNSNDGRNSINTNNGPNGSNIQKNSLSERNKVQPTYYAIKKFKTEKEGVEQLHYIGISQSACREMSLCRELDNNHLTKLVEIFLERKNIHMVYEYAEHDLLQIIHYHSHPKRRMIPARMIRSIMWQIIDGVSYLHQNWILHRDLKPANIMVTVNGVVKIGDLGLARKFSNLLQTLYTGDKVVVTIWYRAPELLLGARHYTPAIDIWAVGCIFAELAGLQPIFKGEEAKMDSKKGVPFQANQMQRILEVLGTPNSKAWSNLHKYPEYDSFSKFPKYKDNLAAWYHSTGGRDKSALDLLYKLLTYDPITRIDAITALDHNYFTNGDYSVSDNVFEGLHYKYPARRIHTDDNDILNLGASRKVRTTNSQSRMTTNNNSSTANLGGVGVNRRILAAAAAAAAAVSGNGIQSGSRGAEPSRKKRR